MTATAPSAARAGAFSFPRKVRLKGEEQERTLSLSLSHIRAILDDGAIQTSRRFLLPSGPPGGIGVQRHSRRFFSRAAVAVARSIESDAHASSSLVFSSPQKHHSFLAGSSDSDSDEDRRVVLKSARDKRLAELHDTVDEIRVSPSSPPISFFAACDNVLSLMFFRAGADRTGARTTDALPLAPQHPLPPLLRTHDPSDTNKTNEHNPTPQNNLSTNQTQNTKTAPPNKPHTQKNTAKKNPSIDDRTR